ncbi:MAG: YdeI/OmpD-associated family protein [Robiginitalea sp.]
MDKKARIKAYFEKEGPFKNGIGDLREIALQTDLEETLKWNAPVYCLEGKNVLGILAFNNHFGLWFYNGVFMKDPLGVLVNAQEGKTRAMRHWRFTHPDQIDPPQVRAYIEEAIAIARNGLVLPKTKSKAVILPPELAQLLDKNTELKGQFNSLAPYKQKDYAEYIASAKQPATRERRLQKSVILIGKGIGLNDQYRKK